MGTAITHHVTTVERLSKMDAREIALKLTKPLSDFQAEVVRRETNTPVSLVLMGGEVVAWAATHRWREMQTIEGFTHPSLRLRGFAVSALTGLIEGGHLVVSETTAVFSDVCEKIARSLGFQKVKLFERVAEGDWIEVPNQ